METKVQQFNTLKTMINDYFVAVDYNNLWNLESFEPVLYGGNLKSRIMVLQDRITRPELYWKNTGISDAFNIFKDAFGVNFFKQHKDFFYTSLFPFFLKSGIKPKEDSYSDFIWIYECIQEIIRPKIIITLGRDTFSYLTGIEVSHNDFIEEVEQKASLYALELENVLIIPLNSPSALDFNHDAFTRTIKYLKTFLLTNKGKYE